MAQVMDYSERLMRATLKDLPDGEGAFEDFCDGDGIADDELGKDAPFRICLSVKKTADRLIVDFAGTDGAGEGTDECAALGHRIGRLLRAQDRRRPEQSHSTQLRLLAHHRDQGAQGLVVNATFPAPVVYANHEISHRVADMVMGALARFMPDQVMACSQGHLGHPHAGWRRSPHRPALCVL